MALAGEAVVASGASAESLEPWGPEGLNADTFDGIIDKVGLHINKGLSANVFGTSPKEVATKLSFLIAIVRQQ